MIALVALLVLSAAASGGLVYGFLGGYWRILREQNKWDDSDGHH